MIAKQFTDEYLPFHQRREPERVSKSDVLVSKFFPVKLLSNSFSVRTYSCSQKRIGYVFDRPIGMLAERGRYSLVHTRENSEVKPAIRTTQFDVTQGHIVIPVENPGRETG